MLSAKEMKSMQFSTRLPVAVHILLCIAVFDGQNKTTSAFLAGSVGVNPVIVRNVLGKLKAAGIVHVDAGVGGAHLAKAPEDISLLDVFQAVEENAGTFHFHENPNPECPVGRNVHAVLDHQLSKVTAAMAEQMSQISLRSMLDETRERIQSEGKATC